jgi:hypothetical protein
MIGERARPTMAMMLNAADAFTPERTVIVMHDTIRASMACQKSQF